MISKKKQRLYYIALFLIIFGAGLSAVLYNLRTHLIFFYTPEEVSQQTSLPLNKIRLGGVVKEKSVKYSLKGLSGEFILTDFKKDILVFFDSPLPDLFREGQGVVAEGILDKKNVFKATRILAKHDENYRPPQSSREVEASLKTLKE